VRSAVVQRVFPNRLKVKLQEHQVVAYWGAEGESRLLNTFGEVFDANVGEIEQEDLPRLMGPENQSAEVLAMYQLIAPHYQQAALPIEELQLSARGSWRARLESGTVVELGRSGMEEVQSASLRFLKTVTQVTSRYGRPTSALQSVDLRHQNGYAIRIHGVSTLLADGTPPKSN
jgi:cell division protein FtsQ